MSKLESTELHTLRGEFWVHEVCILQEEKEKQFHA